MSWNGLWGGPETVIVISSDLSHYLDYETAREIDAATCKAIETLDASAIGGAQACGRIPVAGLLTLARRRGLRATTLDLRNSGDTAGDRDRVVGYGAWMFTEDADAGGQANAEQPAESETLAAQTRALLDTHGATLLRVAATSIKHGLDFERPLGVDMGDYPEALRDEGASFVTLKRDDRLRGCIGSPSAYRPLIVDVAENGFAAAFKDSRFPKLNRDELTGLARVHLGPEPAVTHDLRHRIRIARPAPAEHRRFDHPGRRPARAVPAAGMGVVAAAEAIPG